MGQISSLIVELVLISALNAEGFDKKGNLEQKIVFELCIPLKL